VFTEPPVLDMGQVVEDSTTKTPLIFVLSPGVVSLASTKWQPTFIFFCQRKRKVTETSEQQSD